MAQAFLTYRPDEEHVSLGDLVDRRGPTFTFEQELDCLDLLLESEATLLWGNHDLAYLEKAPWSIGKRNSNEFLALQERYQAAFERFKAAYAIDSWLCTHAGISSALADDLAAIGAPFDSGDAAAISEWLNAEFRRQIKLKKPKKDSEQRYGVGPLFRIDRARGGNDQYGGIFWYDPRWEIHYPPDPRVMQIFAHTKVEGPMKKPTWVDMHIEDGYWVYDTDIDNFVLLRPDH